MRTPPETYRCAPPPDGGGMNAPNPRPQGRTRPETPQPETPCYGALDLGTNNCRLLIATPTGRGFRVVDAFSRIIRLGEGVAHSGQLSETAMTRTIEALKVCAACMRRYQLSCG